MNNRQIQCMCGWTPPASPQHLWTKQEYESVAAHQRAHIKENERLANQQQTTEPK